MNIQTINHRNLSFINVTNPGELEVKHLTRNFGFDVLHLDDFINKIQTPKIEVFKNYCLIVLDFPTFTQNNQNGASQPKEPETTSTFQNLLKLPRATLSSVPVSLPSFPQSEKRKRIQSSQVNFFIGKDYLVVLHDGVLDSINEIFKFCQKTLAHRNELMGDGPVFLAYRIIDVLVDSCFPLINELSTTIDLIDRELENAQSQKRIGDISMSRRNIVYFQTMIKPSIPLFRHLEDGKYKELNGTMQPFWGNIVDHLSKIWERLEDSRELLEGISRSYESYLTSKTNEIVKVLTIFSAIILPLNLLAGIYGMNIPLPLFHENYVFIALMGTMFLLSVVMLITFKWKDWF